MPLQHAIQASNSSHSNKHVSMSISDAQSLPGSYSTGLFVLPIKAQPGHSEAAVHHHCTLLPLIRPVCPSRLKIQVGVQPAGNTRVLLAYKDSPFQLKRLFSGSAPLSTCNTASEVCCS